MVSFRACKPRLYPYSVPGTSNLVNITLNMRYKSDKNIKFVVTRFVFSSSNARKSVFGRPRWGSSRRFPRSSSRLRRGIPPTPSLFPSSLDASASRTRRCGALVLRPPQLEILATPVRPKMDIQGHIRGHRKRV